MKTASALLSAMALAVVAGLAAPAHALEFEYSYPEQHEIESRQIEPAQPLNVMTTYYGSAQSTTIISGNPAPAPAPKLDAVIHFASADAQLSKMSQHHLHKIAHLLTGPAYRGTHVNVCGFSDSSGNAAVNQRLSSHRALAVMWVLEADGVPAAMLSAQGYGADHPIASNATAEGRAENRRVSFVVSH